jgi:hypothetical protein
MYFVFCFLYSIYKVFAFSFQLIVAINYKRFTLMEIWYTLTPNKGCYQCVAQSEYESSQASAQLKLGDSAPIMLETFKDGLIIDAGSSM